MTDWIEMLKTRRVAILTKDATLYKDSVQLHYDRDGMDSVFSGPLASICPPVEKLKTGTIIHITYDAEPEEGIVNPHIIKVELA